MDECENGVARCHPNAVCKNAAPGYCCQCKDGYYGSGVDCVKEGKVSERTDERINENSSSVVGILDPLSPSFYLPLLSHLQLH